tara:strand:- start:598 stop:744 length:147 start_codon:yes stop_codon:yes gene_type:complete
MDKVRFYTNVLIEQLNVIHQRVKDGDITPNQTAKDIKRIAHKLTQLNK